MNVQSDKSYDILYVTEAILLRHGNSCDLRFWLALWHAWSQRVHFVLSLDFLKPFWQTFFFLVSANISTGSSTSVTLHEFLKNVQKCGLTLLKLMQMQLNAITQETNLFLQKHSFSCLYFRHQIMVSGINKNSYQYSYC